VSDNNSTFIGRGKYNNNWEGVPEQRKARDCSDYRLNLKALSKKTIAYITESAVDDRLSWSGTAHYAFVALTTVGFSVVPLGPARPGLARLILAAANKVSLLIFSRRFDYRHSAWYAKAFGRIFSEKLRHTPHDMVVVCGGTEYGAYLQSSKPVVYILDRTIQGAIGYHSILSRLWQFSKKQSIATDRKAMRGASMLLFSSEWAAGHARNFYGINDQKITVAPFGANMDLLPNRSDVLAPKPTGGCRVLLIGTSWLNKGADIALNAIRILNEKGMKAELTVVGCEPPEDVTDAHLTVIKFADKNTVEGRQLLHGLYLSHHFFILPTRFDCTPIVFCEASAYGLPVISADTGGVAGHVTNGVNGFLVPYDDQGAGYAELIYRLFSEQEKYNSLRASARNLFEESLNWTKWGERFSDAVKTIA
jgi:glycosyltransferase involved in cell wall biosynthesis